MRVGLFGDIHGNYAIFYDLLMHSVETQHISIAFQVGDFGLSEEVLKHKELFHLPVPLYVIDGNHEDFKFILNSLQIHETEKWASHNLHYQPRGSVATIKNIRAGFIGGALNVDQQQHRQHGNYITNDDINKALRYFDWEPLDIIISHSCPAGIGIGMNGSPFYRWGVANHIIINGYDPGPSGDYGETQLTALWERMKRHPKLWVYGHFHIFQATKIDNTQFVCLPRIDVFHKCIIWDTESGEITVGG